MEVCVLTGVRGWAEFIPAMMANVRDGALTRHVLV